MMMCYMEITPSFSKQVDNFITIIEELYVKEQRKHNTSLHVAFIVLRGKIISVGTNSVGSRSRGPGYNDRTIHAEMAALKKVDWRLLDGADMYVFRWRDSTNTVTYSYPCHSCMTVLNKLIKGWGLNRVYYSTYTEEDKNVVTQLSSRAHLGSHFEPIMRDYPHQKSHLHPRDHRENQYQGHR